MSILLKVIYRFNTIPIKISMEFFTELEKNNPKLFWDYKCQSNIENKNKVGGTTLPDLKLYYKNIIIKTEWHWHKKKHIDQWNRAESPEINLHLYGQLIFGKRSQNIQ